MNTVKFLFLITLFVPARVIIAQQDSYCFLISKADSCLFAGNNERSLQYYKMAFDAYPDSVVSRDIARSLKPAVLVSNSAHIRRSAERLLPRQFALDADTYAEIAKIRQDSLYKGLKKFQEWNKVLAFYSDSSIRKNVHYNQSLSNMLEEIFDKDQRMRLKIDSIYRSGVSPANQHLIDSLSVQVRINDSLNLIVVTGILDKHGWPGIEQVGEKANTALFSVIQHADLQPDIQKKYLPLLKAAVKRGNARGQYLAMLMDRISMRESGKQLYGTQVTFNPATGTAVPKPLISTTDVDMYRASVGLPPLSYYLTLFTRRK